LLTLHPCIICIEWSQVGAHYFLVYLFEQIPPPPNGIRSADRPACSELLYQLSYPAHNQISYYILIFKLHVSILYTDHYQVLYRNNTDRLYCLVSTVAWQDKWNKMKSCVSTHPVFVPTDRSTNGWQVIKVIYLEGFKPRFRVSWWGIVLWFFSVIPRKLWDTLWSADQTATHTQLKIPLSHRNSKFSWWWAHSCSKHVENLKWLY